MAEARKLLGHALQPYDLIPHVLQAETMPKSSQAASLCRVGACPVIGSFTPASMYAETVVFRDPNETHRLFVVMEYPEDASSFWMGPEGKFLVSLLHQQRAPGVSIAVGYLVKCMPASGTKGGLNPDHAKYCSSHLFEEISTFKADAVMILGNSASKIFLGDGLSGTCGKVKWLPYRQDKLIPVIANVSTRQVARNAPQGSVFRVVTAKLMYWMLAGQENFNRWTKRAGLKLFVGEEGINELEQVVDDFLANKEAAYCAFDTETRDFSQSENKLYSFGFAFSGDFAYSIDVEHPRSLWTPEQKERIKVILRRLCTAPDKSFIAHNAPFDIGIVSITLRIRMRRVHFDTQAMAHGLEEEFRSKEYTEMADVKYIYEWQGLAPQTEFWTELDDHGWHNMKKQRGNLAALLTEKVNEYCGLDCANTFRIFTIMAHALHIKSPTAYASMYKIIQPIQYVLSHIKEKGLPIDNVKINYHMDARNPDSAAGELIKLEKAFLQLPKVKELNKLLMSEDKKGFLFQPLSVVKITSNDHLARLFYDVIGHVPLEVLNRKSGEMETKRPTDKNFLQDLIDNKYDGWQEAESLLSYRQYTKLTSTFLLGFLTNSSVHADGRVRANYHSTKVVSHRLSASDPNTQQIPRGGEENNKAKGFVKQTIRAPEGYVLVGADLGTAEVRVGAIAANDQDLADTFNNAEKLKSAFLLSPLIVAFEKWKFEGDSHRNNAAAAYNVPIRQVTSHQRQAAKNVSFLCIYSADPAPQLAMKINSTVEEAQVIVNGFLGKFVGLRAYLESRDVIAENYGLVHTPLGRTRSLYAAMFRANKKAYSHAINQARNNGIQSSASDILLLAIYEVVCYIEDNNKDWEIVNVVHDSVLACIPIGEEFEFGKVLKKALENPNIAQFGLDPQFCALGCDLEFGLSYSNQIVFDGTPQHEKRISDWILKGCPEDDEPESYFTECLGLSGKIEKLKDKIKDGTSDELEAKMLKLENELTELTTLIERDYPVAA